MGYLANLIILFRRLMPLIKKIRRRMERKNKLLRFRPAFIRKWLASFIPYLKIGCIFAWYLIIIRRISNKNSMKKHFLLLILSLLFLPIAQGKVKLPAMMGDHMVLQQNSSVKLWGWADGKKVTVTTSWNNRTYQASTDKDGAWLVKVYCWRI